MLKNIDSAIPLKYPVIKTKEQYDDYSERLWNLVREKNDSYQSDLIEEEIQLLELLLDAFDATHLTTLTLTPQEILKLMMNEHNLTQRDMAEISGLSKSYLSEILSGKKGIPKNAIAKFAKHFKIRQELLNPVS